MTVRELADSPITFDHDGFKGIVADAADGRLNKLNADVTSAADLEKELQEVVDEAADEVGKLAAAQKRFDDAVAAEADADGAEAQRAAQKEMRAAKTALDAAKAEYDIKEAEILAKLLDILQRAGLISGETGTPLDDDGGRDDQDPTKPKSDKPSSDSPGDKPSSDNPSSDDPSSPGQTQLSADTATPTQPQAYPSVTPQQAQQQPQPSAAMSPSAGMPTAASPSAFNSPRLRSDKDKDKPKPDTDLGAMPVASPVPVAVPLDRGSSVNGGLTTRDISGKPSTSLSTAGQVPGASNVNNARGMGGSGGMVGGAPIGGGNKTDTSAKRSSKRFDIESLFTKDDDDQSVNSGTLSKDILAAAEKAREDEKERMYRAMRD
ncbi:MAG: hypothetical protein KDB26_16335, partial [Microthrixaceae bacterium]|nr:hypothetical protein [Microthrixaceae bacterium]